MIVDDHLVMRGDLVKLLATEYDVFFRVYLDTDMDVSTGERIDDPHGDAAIGADSVMEADLVLNYAFINPRVLLKSAKEDVASYHDAAVRVRPGEPGAITFTLPLELIEGLGPRFRAVMTFGYPDKTLERLDFAPPTPIVFGEASAAPIIQLDAASSDIDEGAGTAEVGVTRSGDLGSRVAVSYATADGSAIAGRDYDRTAGVLTFEPGELRKTIAVPILDDRRREGPETFSISLGDPTGGAVLGGPTSATLTIRDDDRGQVAGDYDGDGQTDEASITTTRRGTSASSSSTCRTAAPPPPPRSRSRTSGRTSSPSRATSTATARPTPRWLTRRPSSATGPSRTPPSGSSSCRRGATPASRCPSRRRALDRPAPADYDGDGTTDIATFRADSDITPGAAQWFILPSGPNPGGFPTTDGAFPVVFGATGGTDLPAPADYDGDGRADIATFRPVSDLHPGAADWFILPSGPNPGFRTTAGAFNVTFGAAGNADQAAVADYNGDGRDDIVAFRSVSDLAPGSSQWFVLPSAGASPGFGGGFPVTFGQAGDIAAVGDYDRDGRPDLAVFAPDTGRWTIRSGLDGTDRDETFGQTGGGVVPVLAPLFFRLRATGNPTTTGGAASAVAGGFTGVGRAAHRAGGPPHGPVPFDRDPILDGAGPSRSRQVPADRGPRSALIDLALRDLDGDGPDLG